MKGTDERNVLVEGFRYIVFPLEGGWEMLKAKKKKNVNYFLCFFLLFVFPSSVSHTIFLFCCPNSSLFLFSRNGL